MQTFLPVLPFSETARILDYKRLGKQRIECLQILNCLIGKSKGWANHPAVKMWSGHEVCLCLYGIRMCDEWIDRGYADTTRAKIASILEKLLTSGHKLKVPKFVYCEKFKGSHRSNLLRKDWDFYSKYDWKEPTNLPYLWPGQTK